MRPALLPDLDPRIPRDRPFTSAEVLAAGVARRALASYVVDGRVRRLLKGVYAAAQLELSVSNRARALSMVMPGSAVATDTTAAWLHGVDLVTRHGGDELPPLAFFQPAGHNRLRNVAVSSGTRSFSRADVMLLHGVRVTTPLRTALDLGRREWPERALATMDGLLRTGTFDHADLVAGVRRFRGHRGVVQLRALAPHADARSESPAESKLRLLWLSTESLPRPELQIRVPHPFGLTPWRVDLGVEELRYGVEYDGAEFHHTSEQRRRDELRRSYLIDELGWTLDVLTKADVYGRDANPMPRIREGLLTARQRLGRPLRAWRWPDGRALGG